MDRGERILGDGLTVRQAGKGGVISGSGKFRRYTRRNLLILNSQRKLLLSNYLQFRYQRVDATISTC